MTQVELRYYSMIPSSLERIADVLERIEKNLEELKRLDEERNK